MTQLLRRGSRITSRLWNGRGEQFNTPEGVPAGTGPIDSPVIDHGPRIVMLSASVGSGHVRAAKAIESALSELLPNATIAHVDVLNLTNPVFRRAYSAGYFRVVENAPHLVGMMYDMLDRPDDRGAGAKARLAFERLNFSRLIRFLLGRPWDLAISTHFLPPAILSWLRRTERMSFPQVTVVTDFDVHGMWINRPCERYFLATQETKTNAIAADVEAGRIDVTGIPIDPRFARMPSRTDARVRLGLSMDRPVVLQMAGGFGVGSIEGIYRSICKVQSPLQMVVVAGKNEEAKKRIEQIPVPAVHASQVLGYQTNMHEWMAAADVIVSKPGGLTTAESLACGCAMVIVEPIPGQEDRNADFLLENGCAIKINNLASLTHKLAALLNDPDRLTQRVRAKFVGRKKAFDWV
jgi:processive 1,2-diacylglycerol beta-glucosyltransferase